jgi:hypothetical protein
VSDSLLRNPRKGAEDGKEELLQGILKKESNKQEVEKKYDTLEKDPLTEKHQLLQILIKKGF